MRFVARLLKEAGGATAVEYSVILALILMVVFTAIALFGTELGTLWGNIASSI